MISEGRVCGLSLIFPLRLLIPQSSLQRKRREAGRGGVKEGGRIATSIKKQERDGWRRAVPSGK